MYGIIPSVYILFPTVPHNFVFLPCHIIGMCGWKNHLQRSSPLTAGPEIVRWSWSMFHSLLECFFSMVPCSHLCAGGHGPLQPRMAGPPHSTRGPADDFCVQGL